MKQATLIGLGAVIVIYQLVIRLAVFIGAIFAIVVFWDSIVGYFRKKWEGRVQKDVRPSTRASNF